MTSPLLISQGILGIHPQAESASGLQIGSTSAHSRGVDVYGIAVELAESQLGF